MNDHDDPEWDDGYDAATRPQRQPPDRPPPCLVGRFAPDPESHRAVGELVGALLGPGHTLAEVGRLSAEVERLKRGDFTEEEFQNLCHNLTPDDARRFRLGCEEYQRKLFGRPAPGTDPR